VHGFVAGIVMLDSETPRIPGDPGHAGTFKFPVCYATAHGFGVDDMLEYRPERLGPAFAAVRGLEQAGGGFVAADCGLFSIYQRDLAAAGEVPFLGSALSLVPLVAQSLSPRSAVGIVTGTPTISARRIWPRSASTRRGWCGGAARSPSPT